MQEVHSETSGVVVIRKLSVFITAFVAVSIATNFGLAQEWKRVSGFNALSAELGSALADGSGIPVSMVEARNVNDDYRPDFSDAEFLNPDKNFVDASNSSAGIANHGTIVGSNFYGNSLSATPGILDITIYEAEDWLNFVTGLATSSNPDPHPFAVQNHSYIGNGSPNDAISENLMRRTDYMASDNDMVMVVGDANSGGLPQFLVHGFNSITVGRADGGHGAGQTSFYIPGRVKPEIVATNGATSFVTPRVSGLAAILRDAGEGTNADHAEIVRAMIFAGATKKEIDGWNNSASRPLDVLYGTGELNIYNSYKIFLAGETDGLPYTPDQPTGSTGWDFGTVVPNQVLNYSIELTEPADHLSIVLNWDITISDSNSSPTIFVPNSSLADLDLFLIGPNGFSQSMSSNHNMEHVYVEDLPAGTYTIAVQGDTATLQNIDFGLAWRAAATTNSDASQLNVLSGISSGNISDLTTSDDNYLELEVEPGENVVSVELQSNTNLNWLNALGLDTEARSSTPNLRRTVEFFNYQNNQFVEMDVSATRIEGVRFGIDVSDSAGGSGYLMYSETPISERFPNTNPRNAVHLIAARFNAGQWQYNNNSVWVNFTPETNDRLLALVDFSADTTVSLEGTSGQVSGIESGYLSGDLEYFANQWNGAENDGEFDVTGTHFMTFGQGEAVVDTDEVSDARFELANFFRTSDGEMRARVTWEPTGPVVMYPWTVRIDRAQFAVSN